MSVRVTAIYVNYWSLADPLCQSQTLPYLRGLARRGIRSALVTFEQPRYRLAKQEQRSETRRLADAGILWYPLRYHRRPPLLATAYDVVRGTLRLVRLAVKHRAGVVHSRASVPGAMALAAALLTGARFVYDADSRLSEEYADNGHWRRSGAAFRTLAWVEARCRTRATAIVVLTRRHEAILRVEAVKAPVVVIPCCVETARFTADADVRVRLRQAWGLGDEAVFVYVGKIGPRYLVGEMMAFLAEVRGVVGRLSLVVISEEGAARFAGLARHAGFPADALRVLRGSPNEVREWLTAADVGVAPIRESPSEAGASPIKIAEYLAAGLPVLIGPGVGDLTEAITANHLGSVVPFLDRTSWPDRATDVAALLQEGPELGRRCRSWACQELDVERVAVRRYERVYRQLSASGS